MRVISDEFDVWAKHPDIECSELHRSCPNVYSLSKVVGGDSYQETLARWLEFSRRDVVSDYVLCLAFTNGGHVVINKVKSRAPTKDNAPGGKILPDEGWIQAASRHFEYYTGIEHKDWELLGLMEGYTQDGPSRIWVVTACSDEFHRAQSRVGVEVTGSGAVICSPSIDGRNSAGFVRSLRTLTVFRNEFLGSRYPRPFLVLKYDDLL